jgi:hypothetical protein
VIPHDTLVALSVSAATPADLEARGLSDLHLRFVFTELVRHLLAAGGCIAYGGRLDDSTSDGSNFTRVMLEMVSGYRPDLRPDDSRLVSFAAANVWNDDDPIRLAAYQQMVAKYQGRFQVEQCPALPTHATPSPTDTPVALALTSMREQMAEQCAARVVLGGQLDGYRGRYPGVIEEAVLTVGAQRALYVIGGFGGAATALAAHINGEALTAPAPPELAAVLPPGDWSALRNGLSEADNQRLASTTDVDEVVALVLRGLHAVATR